jgi:hypothetical protein
MVLALQKYRNRVSLISFASHPEQTKLEISQLVKKYTAYNETNPPLQLLLPRPLILHRFSEIHLILYFHNNFRSARLLWNNYNSFSEEIPFH